MAAERPIPIYDNLTDLYADLGTSLNHAVRWDHLAKEFQKRFGRQPTYIARAPGRVNLIGEHIDYALFGVLPAAIERDVLIACAPRSGTQEVPGSVNIENLHSKYLPQNFAPSKGGNTSNAEGWHLDINTKELRWESYVKAGYYGVLNHYISGSTQAPVSVDLLVTGSVPAGSGLSSSAAMVVASTLAFLAVNEKLEDGITGEAKLLNKGELVKLCMENEKRVGVNSGGMDQAASVISDPSSALYITFFPRLTATPVPLPKGAVFICANSLVVADKAVGAKRGYNLRVVETLVGARVLANALGVSVAAKEKVTYREVLGRWIGEKDGAEVSAEGLARGLEKIVGQLDVLKPKGWSEGKQLGVTMEEMIQKSGLEDGIFKEVYLSWVEVEATHFQLYKRAQHVYEEALRVLQFRQTCLDAATSSGALETLGGLMNESQTSCSELFECSCPELNQLTQLARQAGAYGSRLTGAGWGGCTVSLVPEDKVEAFITRVAETYPPYKGLKGEELNEVIFGTRPSSGACVYKFD